MALQAVGARPRRVVANFRKLHNGSLPGSYSRWGRDLPPERLLRNNDVNSSLGMWEQCSNPMRAAISVIRKPEKWGGLVSVFVLQRVEYSAGACEGAVGRQEGRRGKQAAARSFSGPE